MGRRNRCSPEVKERVIRRRRGRVASAEKALPDVVDPGETEQDGESEEAADDDV